MTDLTCRCCSLKLDSEGISFHINMKGAGDELTLRDKLMECIPEIKIRKESQDVICVNCFALLTSAHNFRNMCLKTNRKLHAVDKVKEADDHGIVELNTEEKSQRVDVKLMGELECKVFINTLPEIAVKHLENGNSIYCCDRCKSLFVEHSNYLAHVSEKCYGNCLYCNLTFRSIGIYEIHMKFMHSREYGVYKLKDCKENNLNISVISQKLAQKLKKLPSSNVDPTTRKKNWIIDCRCVMCKKQFYHRVQLAKHLIAHKSYCFRCLECNNLESDKSLHACTGNCGSTNFEPPWFTETRCPFCYEGLPSVMELYDHITQHSDLKKYCFTCYLFFNTVWEMGLHFITNKCISTHIVSNLREMDFFSCYICKKVFGKKSALRRHFQLHYDITVCSKCNSMFKNFFKYTNHLSTCGLSSPVENNIEQGILDTVSIKQESELFEEEATTIIDEERVSLIDPLDFLESTMVMNEDPQRDLEETEPISNAMTNQPMEAEEVENEELKDSVNMDYTSASLPEKSIGDSEQETEMVTSTT